MNRVVPVLLLSSSVAFVSLVAIFASPFGDDAEDAEAVLAENDVELGRDVVEQPAQPAAQQILLDNRKPGSEPLDDALVSQSRERALRRAELITRAVDSEAVDPEWAAVTEQQIAERFAAKAPADFKLLSTTCKTSMCIAEIETPSREASQTQTGWQKFFGLPRTRVYHRGEEGDAFRTVVFLGRDSKAFPK